MKDFGGHSDEELIVLVQQDDSLAFEAFYDRYWKKLYYQAARKTNSLEDAQEIVQNIFTSLWLRRHQLQIESNLASYLAVAVKYKVFKYLAQQYKQEAFKHDTEWADFDNSTEDWLQFEELRVRLDQLVSELPEKCQLVFKLSREEGLTYKQIAEHMNISVKTVETQLSRALKKIRAGIQRFLITL
ncbi:MULTISPECIES: RNA polymerase sigma-70 factor [Sphingobacterium]|jgi:RNA polymerase sigma-70 factor (family 1)|uniref:RNA polymerase sigma-70 factor n=1 Tax=Sphingobacterium TaxID=28453 RepID=UPI000E873B5A|nr:MULTISPECIES: RNA polymerase sigma-70 factor [Sphingobacterium]HAT91091.1 RNA polymerase sigma-70 factor [Sphingobacterium sp.]